MAKLIVIRIFHKITAMVLFFKGLNDIFEK